MSKQNKKSNIISSLKRKNNKLIKEIDGYLKDNTVSEKESDEVSKFKKRVYRCSNMALYKQSRADNIIDFLSVHTCKSKTCFVCNFLRQKTIRRKYAIWFNENETLLETKKQYGNNEIKYMTRSRYEKKFKNTHEIVGERKYDLMHLTLTLPHTIDGFLGEKYYFNRLKEFFKYMRKESSFWSHWVMGGEYGIETTAGTWINKETAVKKGIRYNGERITKAGKTLVHRMNTNGLNIHMHCLLLVRREWQNRNTLHKLILMYWNKITANSNDRSEFDNVTRRAIRKGNSTLTDTDIDKMYPSGATMITLETIFSLDKGVKVRGGNEFNSEAMRKAVMETISYHFEPLAFEKENGEINIELLIQLLPVLRNFRLYSKFGCLEGEKTLNVSENGITLQEDFEEAVKLLVDENTGELLPEFEYFLTNPVNVFHEKKEETFRVVLSKKAKEQKIPLIARTTGEAIKEMNGKVISRYGFDKSLDSSIKNRERKIIAREEQINENIIESNYAQINYSDVINAFENNK